MNKVADLREHKFDSLPYGDKIKIKQLGRPVPNNNLKTKSQAYVKLIQEVHAVKEKHIELIYRKLSQ